MSDPLPAVVANTDLRWFEHFRPADELRVIDEVNFWRPAAQGEFRALIPGEPLFFRLKSPINAIAGFGFLAVQTRLSVAMAWEFFGEKNGDPTQARFEDRINGYRRRLNRPVEDPLSCLVLRDAVFLPSSAWRSWQADEGWQRNVVAYKGYDLTTGPGQLLDSLLRQSHPNAVPDLLPDFTPLESDARLYREAVSVQREGQGTFRLRLLRAYHEQCAVTGEHAVPVLEAAHIQSYLGPASNHPQNGLILRSDLHRLYDAGYVTVTPDLRLEVSPRLREEYENGKAYYAMAGRQVRVPSDLRLAPSRDALLWHAEKVFR